MKQTLVMWVQRNGCNPFRKVGVGNHASQLGTCNQEIPAFDFVYFLFVMRAQRARRSGPFAA